MREQRIHLAFDKFRGSLTQTEINNVIKSLIPPTFEVNTYLMADGGEGSLVALYALGWQPMSITAAGTLGEPKVATVARFGSTNRYAIELAEICGAKWLTGKLEPYKATTLGIGQVIESLRILGATEILIFVGGSASSDGGLGVLQGLGIRVLQKNNQEVNLGLSGLKTAFSIVQADIDRVKHQYSDLTFTIVHDTHATLIGPENSIKLFAAQKGLNRFERVIAAKSISKWAYLLRKLNPYFNPLLPGTGAAGGVVSAFTFLFQPKLITGFEFFSNENKLANSILPNDLIFTGEGRFDETSLTNKIVTPTIQLANKIGAHCIVVLGSITKRERQRLQKYQTVKELFVIKDYAESTKDSIERAKLILQTHLPEVMRRI